MCKGSFLMKVPVLVLPDVEPFDQVLGALKFGVETILLTFEPRHIFHGHTVDTDITNTHVTFQGIRKDIVRRLTNVWKVVQMKEVFFFFILKNNDDTFEHHQFSVSRF